MIDGNAPCFIRHDRPLINTVSSMYDKQTHKGDMMARTVTQEEAREQLKQGSEKVTEDDVQKVVDKAEDIKGKFESHGPLGRFVNDVKVMLSLISDYWNGSYREVPWWAISAVVAALLYVLSPIDLIPDVIPVIGYIDDAAVVGACLLMVEQQLSEYESWKSRQPA